MTMSKKKMQMIATMISAFGTNATLPRLSRIISASSSASSSLTSSSSSSFSSSFTSSSQSNPALLSQKFQGFSSNPSKITLENQRRFVSSILSTVIFACQKSEICVRESHDALIAHLPELLSGLKDDDQFIQTNVVACFTIAQIDIVDALISMATRLIAPRSTSNFSSSLSLSSSSSSSSSSTFTSSLSFSNGSTMSSNASSSRFSQLLQGLKSASSSPTPRLASLAALLHVG